MTSVFSGSSEFEYGLIYTVHPRILAPLARGEEYRILVSTRILIPRHEQVPSYEPLYRRARLLASRRAEELTCAHGSDRPQTWTVSHGWFRMDISDAALAGAMMVLGVVCGMTAPQGREEPTSEALSLPYTPDMATDRSVREGTWDEFYNDFDMRRPDRPPLSAATVSYGEYVFTRDRVDVDALISRAQRRARSYFDVVDPNGGMTLARHEWTCLDTGKQSRPLLAHVLMHFSA